MVGFTVRCLHNKLRGLDLTQRENKREYLRTTKGSILNSVNQ